MSSIKDKVSNVISSSSSTGRQSSAHQDETTSPADSSLVSPTSDDDTSNSPKDYFLHITGGPSYDKTLQQTIPVNTSVPLAVSDEVSLTFRVKGYNGFPTGSPRTSSAYFSFPSNANSTFSLAFSFTPSPTRRDTDISTENLYFGIDTGHNPIKKFGLPKALVRTAVRIVTGTLVDPSLESDPFAEQPWIMGPVLAGSTMRFCIRGTRGEVLDAQQRRGRRGGDDENDTHGQGETRSGADGLGGETIDAPSEEMVEGAMESGTQVREQAGLPPTSDKRRKHFLDRANRAKFTLQRGRTYEFDWANGYLDLENYRVKLPGFSVGVLRYIGKNSHKVRFVLKDVKTGEVFFVVMATLLTGRELDAQIAAEKNGRSTDEQGNRASTGEQMTAR